MSRRISLGTKNLVFELWLNGNTYSKIAKLAGIGKGTVSDIINNLKNENSGYTYLNTLGKFMQDNDIDPRSFTQIIRLEKKIKLLGISDKLVDDFFDQLDEHTFKHGLDLPSFLKDVANLLALVNRFGMSLSDDWNLVQNLDYRIVTLEGLIERKENEYKSILNRNANIILEIEANKRKDQLPRDNELFRRDPTLLEVAERGLPGNTSFNSFPGIIQSIYLDCVENIIADEKKQFTS